jgi:hypothetical protein
MAQHDMNLANADGATFRADANNALAALVSQNSGATAPATTFAYQWWADTDLGLLKIRNAANSAWVTVGTLADANLGLLTSAVIGTTVQAYDADTAKLDVDQTWTGAQRGTITTDADGSFDQSVTNNFLCTPTGNVTLTFTNHTAGQSGFVLFDNTGAYTGHSLAATTKASASFLTTINVSGVFLISYLSNGTNTYVVAAGPMV